MKELVAEYDCFISAESSNNLQLINHNRINNQSDIKVINAKYKHKIPELQMTVEHKGYESNCKSSIQSTETSLFTEVDDINKAKSNFVMYFSGKEAHFVPLTRPILNSYIANDSIPEYKKNVKDKSKQDYNPITESRNSFNKFHEISKNREFSFISDSEKTRQPWIPVNVESKDNMLSDFRQSALLCYKREELKNVEIPVAHKTQMRKPFYDNINRVGDANKNPISGSSLESEILNILIDYKVIRFCKLIELIKDRHQINTHQLSEKMVLKHLPKIALSIRGHWVIKSEVFYRICPRDGKTHLENLCLARDYILCVFYMGEEITARTVRSVTKVASETATEILSHLSERINDSKSGLWKFPEHDFDFISNHTEISTNQIAIMDQKVKEVCSKLKMDHLGGKSDDNAGQKSMKMETINDLSSSSNRRLRTYSFQEGHSQNSLKRTKSNDDPLGGTNPKRLRQNSTPSKSNNSLSHDEVIDPINEESEVPRDVALSFQGDSENISQPVENPIEQDLDEENENNDSHYQHPGQSYMVKIKEEPNMSPHGVSSNCENQIEDDSYSYIKPEPSEFFCEKENETQPDTVTVPPAINVNNNGESKHYFTHAILSDIKKFVMSKLIGQYIIPINNLAVTYVKEYLPKIQTDDSRRLRNADESSLVDEISLCIIDVLNELKAEKIDITWPQMKTALPEQTLYFYSKESLSDGEREFFNLIVSLLKLNGQFVIGDFKKKAVVTDLLKMSVGASDNLLRDRLKKYCDYVHRKYFLKHTVSLMK